MPLLPSLNYYRRIASAYLLGGQSHLTFWHEPPEENLNASARELGEYYMLFAEKANYAGTYDSTGIPQLDYRGKIGRQYNPIAIAQYGLGNYNLFRRSGERGVVATNSCRLQTGSSCISRKTRKDSRSGITTSIGNTAIRCALPGIPRWRRDKEFQS